MAKVFLLNKFYFWINQLDATKKHISAQPHFFPLNTRLLQ